MRPRDIRPWALLGFGLLVIGGCRSEPVTAKTTRVGTTGGDPMLELRFLAELWKLDREAIALGAETLRAPKAWSKGQPKVKANVKTKLAPAEIRKRIRAFNALTVRLQRLRAGPATYGLTTEYGAYLNGYSELLGEMLHPTGPRVLINRAGLTAGDAGFPNVPNDTYQTVCRAFRVFTVGNLGEPL